MNFCRLRRVWTLRHLPHDQLCAILVPVGPLVVRRHHRAGLALVRGRAPPLGLIRFCSLARFTVVSTSENAPKPVQTRAQWKAWVPLPERQRCRCSPYSGIPQPGSVGPSRVSGMAKEPLPQRVPLRQTLVPPRQQHYRVVPRDRRCAQRCSRPQRNRPRREIVTLGPDGVPSFSRLQRRMHVLKPTAQLRNDALTAYYVFDVLDIDGTSTPICRPSNAAKLSPTSASNTRESKSPTGSTSTDRPYSRSPTNTISKVLSPKILPRSTSPTSDLTTKSKRL